MTRTMVKFCGITRREDAWLAADLGADAVGFIFWPGSPRVVRPDEARDIVRSLPPFIVPVGVFVDQPLGTVRDTARLVGLWAVQLHGQEQPAFAAALGVRVIKAVGEPGSDVVQEADSWPIDVTLLVDAVDPARRGGTGQKADWETAAALASTRRIVLAGGLTPEIVADAIAAVQPYAVDVSSGVEDAPGLKNHARMRAFMDAVQRRDHRARRRLVAAPGGGQSRHEDDPPPQ